MLAPTPSSSPERHRSVAVIPKSHSSESLDPGPGQQLLYIDNSTDTSRRSMTGSIRSLDSSIGTLPSSEPDPEADTAADTAADMEVDAGRPHSDLRLPSPSPRTARTLRDVRHLISDPALRHDKVLIMGPQGLTLAGSPRSDATVALRERHALPVAATAAKAAQALQDLMRRTGHRVPPGPQVTLDDARTALQSIAPRDHEGTVDAQVLDRTVAGIREDILRWESQGTSTEVSREQLFKDVGRCDYSVDGVALSRPGDHAGGGVLHALLEQQPLDMQRFIHASAHQGSLANAWGALVGALHEDPAVLSSTGIPIEQQTSTHFHIMLADQQHPSVSIQHTRRIARASAMLGADGSPLDIDNAPMTTAASGCTLALTLTLDRATGRIDATGVQQLRLTYPTVRALHLDRILTASQADAPTGDHMLDGLRDYAHTLDAALPGAAGPEAVHDFHRRAVTELAEFRGERVPVVAARLAHHMQALDGLLIDGPSALQQLQAEHPLPPEQVELAASVLADAALLGCAASLQRCTLSIANSGPLEGRPQIMQPPAAASLSTAHPVIRGWLHAAGLPVQSTDSPVRIDTQRPGLARHLSRSENPAERDAVLSRLSIAAADLIVAVTDDGLPGIAEALLATPASAPGRTLTEVILDDAVRLQQHGVETGLHTDLPRFTFDLLARHVADTRDTTALQRVLDTLLQTAIPSPAGESRPAYLACCHLLAACLYVRGKDTPWLRGFPDQGTLLRRVDAWVQSGTGDHGPLPELSALLPHRGLIGRWSTSHVRMPPPVPQHTGDGSARVETVVDHLKTLHDCINQIIHHTRPPTDTPPDANAPGGGTASGIGRHRGPMDLTTLTHRLDILLSSRSTISTPLRLAELATSLKAAMALPDKELVTLLLRPAITSRLVALAATEALTPCAGSRDRDATTFCTLVAATLGHALAVTGEFGSDTMTNRIRAAFDSDGAGSGDEPAEVRARRSAPAKLLMARGTDAARELATLLYVRVPAYLEQRGAKEKLLDMRLHTPRGSMTLGDALQTPPRVGTHPLAPSWPAHRLDASAQKARVASLADAVIARLPAQLSSASNQHARMRAADVRLHAVRERKRAERRSREAESHLHLQRYMLVEAAAEARHQAANTADTEWHAARHREERELRLHHHNQRRETADALARAAQLASYHEATIALQVRRQQEQAERTRLYGPDTSPHRQAIVAGPPLHRTTSDASVASTGSLASKASHATVHSGDNASSTAGEQDPGARASSKPSSEANLMAWLDAHEVPDDDAPPATRAATALRTAPAAPLRSDVPSVMWQKHSPPTAQSVHPDLARAARNRMTPEDDAATTAALQTQVRAITARTLQIAEEAHTQRQVDARRGRSWAPAEPHAGWDVRAARERGPTSTAYVSHTEQEIVAAMAPLGLTPEQQEPRLAAYSRNADALQDYLKAPPQPESALLDTLATLRTQPADLPEPSAPSVATEAELRARLARMRAGPSGPVRLW